MNRIETNYRALLKVAIVLNSQRDTPSLWEAITEQINQVMPWARACHTGHYRLPGKPQSQGSDRNGGGVPEAVVRRRAGKSIIIYNSFDHDFRYTDFSVETDRHQGSEL